MIGIVGTPKRGSYSIASICIRGKNINFKSQECRKTVGRKEEEEKNSKLLK